MTFIANKYHWPILLALCTILAFWKLGESPIMVWDESRNGVTAIEMSQNGDYLNLYYGGRPDDWSVKPPLFIWILNLSFDLFGKNAFALRFPSALASIFTLFWVFQLSRLYRSSSFAFGVGLVLLSVKGFLGPHVGRSGDYDALLMCFLVGGLYYFLRYLDFKYSKGIYLLAVLWGLAFWVKGPAAFILFPGVGLFLIVRKKLMVLLNTSAFWKAAAIFILICGTWILAIYAYGATFEIGAHRGTNAFQRIFLNDVLTRFSSSEFDGQVHSKDYAFFFTYLDARFNLWNYFFYLACLALSFTAFKKRKSLFALTQNHPLLLLSICLWTTTGLFFTLSSTKHHWYMAPITPFIAITLLYGLQKYWSQGKYIFVLLISFTVGRQLYQFSTPNKLSPELVQLKQHFTEYPTVALMAPLPLQDKMLYLYFWSDQIIYADNFKKANAAQMLLIPKTQEYLVPNNWVKKGVFEDHLLFEQN